MPLERSMESTVSLLEESIDEQVATRRELTNIGVWIVAALASSSETNDSQASTAENQVVVDLSSLENKIASVVGALNEIEAKTPTQNNGEIGTNNEAQNVTQELREIRRLLESKELTFSLVASESVETAQIYKLLVDQSKSMDERQRRNFFERMSVFFRGDKSNDQREDGLASDDVPK